MVGLLDRLLAWRDRLLASDRFRTAAARFPLTRAISRRRARSLFDVVAGFTYSQVLLACVRIGLIDFLLERPRRLDEIAARAGLETDAARRLIDAAVSLRLVEPRRDARYGLGAIGAPMANNPGLSAMVEHHAALYADLVDPLALLRGQRPVTALGDVWGYARDDDARGIADARVAAYSRLMTLSQPLVAGEILAAYPMERHRCLLDVGGGEGAFLVAAARRAPSLRLMLFDLPAVAVRAAQRFESEGLAKRAEARGGDFAVDPLPAGADIATLVRVIHDHDDARAMRILENVRRALTPGGTLLVAEPMSGTPGAEPMGAAYFGMYLLAMGSGRPRTATELTAMLEAAGFERIRLLPTDIPLQVRVLAAVKPR